MPYTAEDMQAMLTNLDACGPAREWIGDKDPETVWTHIPDYHWMTWVIRQVGLNEELEAIYNEVRQKLGRGSQKVRLRKAREIVRSHVTAEQVMSSAESKGLLAS